MAINGVYNEEGEPLGIEYIYESDPNDYADALDYNSDLDDWYGDRDEEDDVTRDGGAEGCVCSSEEYADPEPEPIRQAHSVFYPEGGSSS